MYPLADALLASLEHIGIKLGLERMRTLLEVAGHPERFYPIILVGGTNGKGSTSSLLAAMFRAAGYRTGHFTSPHLETVHERIRVDGTPIAEDDLLGELEQWLQLAAARDLARPTYFESLTLAAFGHFRARLVDVAVMEVGLGGRLDATNCCDPILSIITPISFDHQAQLGTTLTAIAREKAGIARAGKILVAWTEPAEVEESLRRHAAEAEIVAAPKALTCRWLEEGDQKQTLEIGTTQETYTSTLSLLGRHQGINLGLALLAAEYLAIQFPRLDVEARIRGAESCRWPGRLEWVDLPDGRQLLLDAAHNPAGMEVLCHYLQQRGRPFHALFGALADKGIPEMLPPLASLARGLTLTRPPSPRSEDPHRWLELCGDCPAKVVDDPTEALVESLRNLPAGGLLVLCGSIYLLGTLRQDLRRLFGVPAPASG